MRILQRGAMKGKMNDDKTSASPDGKIAQKQSSELTLHTFAANLPGIAYRLRQNMERGYSFDYISSKCLLLFGHSAAAIEKDPSLFFALLPQADFVDLEHALCLSALELTPCRQEHRILSSTGDTIWLRHSAMPKKTAGGDIIWDGVGLDITAWKFAERAQRISEETLRKAQRICKMTSWRLSLAEQGVADSQAEFLLFDQDQGPSRLSYPELSRFIHPEDRNLFRDVMEKARNEEKGFDLELRTLGPAGETTFGHLVADIIRDDNGQGIELIGTMRDITANKAAERERKAEQEVAEKRYRSVVEDQTEIISRMAAGGTVLFVNEAYCRFFKKDRREIVGKSYRYAVYEQDIKNIDGLLAQLSVENPVIVNENRVHKGDGCLCWVQFINRGIFNAENVLIEIQSVGRDITDLKNIQASLQQKDVELRRKNDRLAKLNIALEVVIDQKNEQLDHLRTDVIHHYNQFVRPYVQDLRDNCQDLQNVQYLKLIEQGILQMLSPFSRKMLSSKHNFTPTEHKIVSLISSGMTISAIAAELKISPHTVKYHRKNIRTKLGLQNKKINLRSYLLQLSQ